MIVSITDVICNSPKIKKIVFKLWPLISKYVVPYFVFADYRPHFGFLGFL